MTDIKRSFSNIRINELGPFLWVNKIPGLNTHASDTEIPGCVEYIESQTQKKTFVVHRIDKLTSGLLLFTQSKEAAQFLFQKFERHEIEKEYLLLTDRKPNLSLQRFSHSSFIDKDRGQFTSSHQQPPNATTHFEYLGPCRQYHLWKACPKTGKSHQIRLHARDLGFPILGDLEHEGSPFYRMCLHNFKLSFSDGAHQIQLQTEIPPLFDQYQNRDRALETPWLSVFEQCYWEKKQFFSFSETHCFRVLHLEIPFLRCDQYGPVLWFYWYKDEDPGFSDLESFQLISQKYQKNVMIRKMFNRGQDPNTQALWVFTLEQNPSLMRWKAEENNIQYELRSDSGLSPGLFLDQRDNREFIKNNSAGLRVLNLFSYTSGFSLSAAKGKAAEVVTVDVSKNFIEWSKRNFEVNQITVPDKRYSFFVQDCLIFLEGTKKRNRVFDIIICDPPSFGRSKDSVFSLEKDFQQLIELCFHCLAPEGILMFSCNLEKWSEEFIQKKILSISSHLKIKIEFLPKPLLGLDFEKPGEDPLMKSFLIQRHS